MKQNIKQSNWARNKISQAQIKLGLMFSLSVILLMFAVSIGAYAVEPMIELASLIDTTFVLGTTGSGIIYGGIMATVGNIDDPVNAQKVGKQVKARLWILAEDQWDDTVVFPARVNREIGDIPLKAGEKWHYIHSVYDSVRPSWKGEEGEIASTITNELPFTCGGMPDSVFNLLENGLNKGFFVVWEICATGEKFLGGNGCKPMRLVSFDGHSNESDTSTNIIFRNECGHIWSKYIGNTPVLDPALVAAAATTITLTSNPRYQLTTGSVSAAVISGFTSVTDADVNRTVTILGSGGAFPSTITAAGNFLLIGGVTWTALEGSKISFKIFKDGASNYTFVEVSGTRV